MKRIVWLGIVALAPFARAEAPRPPDPADPKASVPALRYESSLAGYRRAEAAAPAPWKAVNEQVGALGGHAGHLKALDRQAPAPAAPASAAEPAKPAAGHRH